MMQMMQRMDEERNEDEEEKALIPLYSFSAKQTQGSILNCILTHITAGKDRGLNLMCDLIDSCGFHCPTKHG